MNSRHGQEVSTPEISTLMVTLKLGGKEKENRLRGTGSSQKAVEGVLRNLRAEHAMDNN